MPASITAAALWLAAAAHPIHTTLTQLAYDDASHTVTVSIRAFADDFGTAVARRARVTPAADHQVPDAASFAYLTSALALLGRDGQPLHLEWCGARRTGDVVWLCLRGPAPAGLAGVRVVNRCHFELFADQINIVQALVGGRRYSLLFTHGDAPKVLTGP